MPIQVFKHLNKIIEDSVFAKLPSLTSIRSFEAAARLCSFKDAANELNVSSTAVSHQIRNLEKELGVTLFERRTREVLLTDEGRALFQSTHKLMKGLKATIDELKDAPTTLTIGTTNAFAAMWLVPNLTYFTALRPNIDVRIKADDQLVDLEQNRHIDVAIRSGHYTKQDHEHGDHHVLLHQETLKAYATPRFWQQYQTCTHDIEVYYTQWKNPHLSQPNVAQAVSNLGIKNATLHSFEDENQTIQAALSGNGVSVVSELLATKPVSATWLEEAPRELSICLKGLDHYCVIPSWNINKDAAVLFRDWLTLLLKTG
ncbi:LysR family transcriptional regulator [Marinomonas mediterranea]|uniref:LysR family transcriptional regulator n=1 Tax=Marinomonas mediterranea TaxID=119864 RepID=UPI00234B7D3D|nr:LysR family transcriptional regulator [Marinomonas mediterranea]WCN13655.1 LysR family transcriptional regulator [Marinomonas mediterranea]